MPPELIFILVLIVFSILENALKRKKKGGPLEKPPEPRIPPGWPPPDNTRVERRGPTREQETKPIPAKRERAAEMVPEEIWEEIAALARGDVEETLERRRARARAEAERARRKGTPGTRTATTRPLPPTSVPREEPTDPDGVDGWEEADEASARGGTGDLRGAERAGEADRSRSRTPRSREPRSREGHHETRLRETRRPSRKRSDAGEARPDRKAGDRRALTAFQDRKPLRGGEQPSGDPARRRAPPAFRGAGALRRAIIAREVLGRPLALREYGDEEMWSN